MTRKSRFIRRADPKKFISLCSLLVAVGEDSDIWKWYGIKRKRLIEFMLITWDLEEKVFFAVIIHHHKQVITTFQMLWKQVRSERQLTILYLYHNRDLIVNLIQDE